MFKGAIHDIFTLCVNFFKEDWMTIHIIIDIFLVFEILGQALTKCWHGLIKKILAYVKNEGANLNIMITL
jgi:hypothetical protein